MNSILERAEALQNLLVAHSTGGSASDSDFRELRQILLKDQGLSGLLPKFITTCRSLDQFWQFIKHRFPTYRERRQFIWEEFIPLISHLERNIAAPSDDAVTDKLETLDANYVHNTWSKAISRRQSHPEGAITLARTLLESVCKHILDDLGQAYDDTADISKLFGTTSKALNLSPSQHTEGVFKQVLGGCIAIVEGLGALRNRLSDAHGKGKTGVKPAPRHAELAVDLAGAMATYLVATWEARQPQATTYVRQISGLRVPGRDPQKGYGDLRRCRPSSSFGYARSGPRP